MAENARRRGRPAERAVMNRLVRSSQFPYETGVVELTLLRDPAVRRELKECSRDNRLNLDGSLLDGFETRGVGTKRYIQVMALIREVEASI